MRVEVGKRDPKLIWGFRAFLLLVFLLFGLTLLPEESFFNYTRLISSRNDDLGSAAADPLVARDAEERFGEADASSVGNHHFGKASKTSGLVEDHLLESGDSFSRFVKDRKAHVLANAIYPSQLSEQEFIQYARLVEGLRGLNDFLLSSADSPVSLDILVQHSLRYTRSLELAVDKLADETSIRAKGIITVLRDNLRDAIYKNQNPYDCSKVQVIGCKIQGSNGFAAGFGDMTHCLASGLMLNKTVVYNFTGWAYASGDLWQELFEPISSCKIDELQQPVDWSYPRGWRLERKHMTLLPEQMARDLVAFHGDPLAWFHGQLASYILRPTKKFQDELNNRVRAVDEDRDYVGLHIRRTDKSSEALLRETKYYMRYVEEYYRRELLQRNVRTKKVYVATDDPAVVTELKRKYPKFNFFSNSEAIEQANDVLSRSNNGALRNVMIDFHVLSRSRYFACALSSGFARVTYSLMQYEYSDAWRKIGSLDVPFYYAYVFEPERIPIEPVEDLVLPNEIGFARPVGNLDSMTAYSLAKGYYFRWAKTKLVPDGTVPTYVGSNVQAKFKTEQPFRVGAYAVKILSLTEQERNKKSNTN